MGGDKPGGVRRRRVLTALGSAAVVGTAGCAGDGNGGDETPTAGGEGSQTTADATTAESGRLPAPSMSSGDLEVTVAVYKDFACPHCATYAAEVEPQVIGEYVDTVESDRSTGIDRGVEGTPTVFVDGEALDGWSREAVDAAIADARSE